MRIALIQMLTTGNRSEDIQTACSRIRKAAAGGADFAVLPEMFCCPYQDDCFLPYSEEENGPVQTAFSALAQELGIYIVGGSIPERVGDKLHNTCYVYDRTGRLLAKHRKMHMFDIDVPGGQRFTESATFTPGDSITTFETEFGTVGLCICFDLRFEELFRCMALRGAKVIFVPAAFNMTTGPAHWELTFRMRALDNQCFMVGVGPARNEQASYVAYGNSIVTDPWGSVMARAGAEETILFADLDLQRIDAIRKQIPILSNRRTDIYSISER